MLCFLAPMAFDWGFCQQPSWHDCPEKAGDLLGIWRPARRGAGNEAA